MKVNPEALRSMRILAGFSVAELARQVEMTPGHLSNVEAGRRGCSPATTKKMAEVLGVPTSALLWRQPEAEAVAQ